MTYRKATAEELTSFKPLSIQEEPSKSEQQIPDEGVLPGILRHPARIAARGAEAILGLPGDIISGVTDLLHSVNPESVKPNKLFPTSQDIREDITKRYTGNALEPQGELESVFDEIASTAAPAFLGGIGGARGIKPIAKEVGKRILPAAAGVGAKEATRLAGLPEGVQGLAQVGASAFSSLLANAGGTKSVEKVMRQNYDTAEKALKSAKGDRRIVNIRKEIISANELKKSLLKGKVEAPERKVIEYIDELKRRTYQGHIKAEYLWDLKKKINRAIDDPEKLFGVERLLLPLNNKLSNALISEYGKINPEFTNALVTADDMFSGLAKARKSTDFIKNHATLQNVLPPALLGAVVSPYKTAATLGVGLPAAKGAQSVLKGIEYLKNPSIRKYYGQFMDATSRESLPSALAAAKNLSKAINHVETNANKTTYRRATPEELKQFKPAVS